LIFFIVKTVINNDATEMEKSKIRKLIYLADNKYDIYHKTFKIIVAYHAIQGEANHPL